jgi:hypothetical protein
LIKKLFGRIISISKWSLIVLSIFPVSSAKAELATYTVTGANDLWFTYTEPSDFKVRTYAWEYGIDSMLWLYDANGVLLAQNDDFFGLDSWLEVAVQPGSYRLRTGVCCGNPDAWYGTSYTVELNTTPTNIPETTTTWPETTTSTTSTTTSTTTAPTTTVPVTEPPTTTSTSTTTEAPTTTTTEPTTTTVTVAPTVTSVTPVLPSVPVEPTTTAPSLPTVPTVTPPTLPPSTTTTTTVASTSTSTSIPESTSSSTSTTTPTIVPVETGPLDSEEEILNLSDEELTDLVESIEVSELTEESIAAVFSEEVLNELSEEQIVELIDAIVPEELSDEQALVLSEALTNAPDDVKEEFEAEVDVFGGQFDTYVPTGSAVSVGARRVIVAAAAASFAMPTPTSSRKVR